MKIILFDLEVFPITALTWGPKWETNLLEIVEHCKLASFAYKVCGEKRTYVFGSDSMSYPKLVKRLWEMAEQADVLVAHNGNSYDIKMMNSFFVEQGLEPPARYQSIDTKLVARRYFRLPSYSLNDLAHYFKLGSKNETGGFGLWKSCMAGDGRAWKKMLSYNKQDVVLLEKVYLKMRPFMSNHPETGSACVCGSMVFHKRGWTYSQSGTRRRRSYRCRECRVQRLGPAEKVSIARPFSTMTVLDSPLEKQGLVK